MNIFLVFFCKKFMHDYKQKSFSNALITANKLLTNSFKFSHLQMFVLCYRKGFETHLQDKRQTVYRNSLVELCNPRQTQPQTCKDLLN